MYSPRPSSDAADNTEFERLTQALVQQIDQRLTAWLEVFEGELQGWREEKQTLIEEIQRIETERQKMLSEYGEILVKRCYEALNTPVNPPKTLPDSLSPWQKQAEQQLVSLDQTLRTVVTGLEKDLQSYQQSLSQGLERLHSLGKQGEAKFLTYFNRFQDQLASVEKIDPPSPPPVPRPLHLHYLGLILHHRSLKGILITLPPQETPLLSTENCPLSWTPVGESPQTVLTLSGEGDEETLWEEGLTTLVAALTPPASFSYFSLHSPTLDQPTLFHRLSHLNGVILGGDGCDDKALGEHLRRSVVGTGLVKKEEQVYVIPPAIAVSLSQPPLTGGILVMQFDAERIKWVLSQGNQRKLGVLSYGTADFIQDILCQFIYPQWLSHFQESSLSLLTPDFPRPGFADRQKREALQQQLQVHPLGQALVTTANLAQLILQEREEFTSALIDQSWGIQRQDVTQRIIQPFLGQLERSLLTLCQQIQIEVSAIQQIICLGKERPSFAYGVIPWLEERFEGKEIIYLWGENEEKVQWITEGIMRFPVVERLSS